MYSTVPYIKIDGESMVPSSHEVVMEVPLAVFVNGRHALTAMISPTELEEFVTGFLYTERIISKLEDLESLRIEEQGEEKSVTGMSASVLTKDPFSIMFSGKTVLSGCGGDTSYLDADRLPAIRSDLILELSTVKNMMRVTLASELHERTGGIHIVGLFGPEGKLCIMEDIGRHNALDKAIGYGLKHGVDFSRTIAVSSGRLSSEMIRKCLIANIPIIASRGATTTLAIRLGEQSGLTILGFVRGQKMNVYTGAERIRNKDSAEHGSDHNVSDCDP
ncbi:formate dehydrogenase accessory sulfurtransferase FdhD [Methanosarcina sp. MSH10X1]|nr:formate dehydrogenase accessory sulfurtransferase FdhD [Methanosarcina sp. MSH10X1]